MSAFTWWNSHIRPLAALVLAAALLSFVSLIDQVAADDAGRKLDGNFDREFLKRIGEAELKEQLQRLREQNGGAGEPRQLQWDRLDERPRKVRGARVEQPAGVMLRQVKIKRGGGPPTVIFVDGDRIEVIIEAVADRSGEGDDLPDRQAVPKLHFRIAQGTCDELLFGRGKNEPDVRQQLFRRLSQKVADANRVCGLTDAQSQKLELAGRGDIHRFFERVREMRLTIEAVRGIGADDQGKALNQVVTLGRQSRALRSAVDAGPFGEGSLFAKALHTMLTPEQAARRARGESPQPAAN